MSKILKAIPIYNFINYCNDSSLSRKVLDCGAGGKIPPLYIFKEYGYETYGIDDSEEQIKKAEGFCKDNQIDLNIKKADMRNLEFDNEEFSFIYSYNSIFHMRKSEIGQVIINIKRILKSDGLCFLNFLSKDDCRYGEGTKISEGEYLQDENGEKIMHSYFDDNEGERYFGGFEVIFKEKRITEKYIDGIKYRLSYIDYIIKNK